MWTSLYGMFGVLPANVLNHLVSILVTEPAGGFLFADLVAVFLSCGLAGADGFVAVQTTAFFQQLAVLLSLQALCQMDITQSDRNSVMRWPDRTAAIFQGTGRGYGSGAIRFFCWHAVYLPEYYRWRSYCAVVNRECLISGAMR